MSFATLLPECCSHCSNFLVRLRTSQQIPGTHKKSHITVSLSREERAWLTHLSCAQRIWSKSCTCRSQKVTSPFSSHCQHAGFPLRSARLLLGHVRCVVLKQTSDLSGAASGVDVSAGGLSARGMRAQVPGVLCPVLTEVALLRDVRDWPTLSRYAVATRCPVLT